MLRRLIAALALAMVVAACGGDGGAQSDSDTSNGEPSSSSGTEAVGEDGGGDGDTSGGSGDIGTSDGGGVAGIDLSGLGAPPEASPGTAVVEVDGQTHVFDSSDLGSARCEVSADSIAVNIGQSEDWFAFVATRSGNAWSTGPSFALEDEPEQEGLTPGSQILVAGEEVTFQGEIVIKTDPTDFDSWKRTVGSVAVNCSVPGLDGSAEEATGSGGDLIVNGDRWPVESTQLCDTPGVFDFIAWGEDNIQFFLEIDEAAGEWDARLNGADVEASYGETTLHEDLDARFTVNASSVVGTFTLGHPDVDPVTIEVDLPIPAPSATCPAH